MGILPLRLPVGVNPQSLNLLPGDRLAIEADADTLAPRSEVLVRVLRANGVVEEMLAIAAVETQLEVTLLRDGGVIPSILLKTIALHAR
jgi:aconitate hydratase